MIVTVATEDGASATVSIDDDVTVRTSLHEANPLALAVWAQRMLCSSAVHRS